jgi:lipid-binding SYLF domain-containing protein
VVLGAIGLSPGKAAARSQEETIRSSHEVLQEFMDLSVRQIPESLLSQAHGVAIIPDVVKIGLVLGGQRGHGVVVMRDKDGSWRAPSFVTITGGSIGWQIGAQATDFVLVFKSPRSVENLMRGAFTLGADAAVAAGPVGRRAGAATDVELKAEIYTYSRSRGLFAGVSLEGSNLAIDDFANQGYYGGFAGAPATVPPSAARLVEIIARLTGTPPASVQPASAQTQPGGAIQPDISLAPGAALGSPAATHLATVQADLARASGTLNPLLDEGWKRYLALPGEVYAPNSRPRAEDIRAALDRYNYVARNRDFQSLSQRPEFHAAHSLLQSLYEDLNAAGHAQLALPPPPGTTAR